MLLTPSVFSPNHRRMELIQKPQGLALVEQETQRRRRRTEQSSTWKRANLQCHVCDKLYKDQNEHIMHIRQHKIAFCDTCQNIIPRDSFSNHKLKCKKILNKKNYKCDQCHFESSWFSCLQRHKKKDHGEHSEECYVCSKNFKDKKALENHMGSHIGFICQVCGIKSI